MNPPFLPISLRAYPWLMGFLLHPKPTNKLSPDSARFHPPNTTACATPRPNAFRSALRPWTPRSPMPGPSWATYLAFAQELRGLINAGHKQGGCAYRCQGGDNAVRAFNAFAPVVISGIGSLHETLRSRSIRLVLLKATEQEQKELRARFDSRHTEIEAILCRKLARWAHDNFAALQACDPPMPPGAYNRVADNWRPIFAIAQIAGGDWPQLALEGYLHLTHQASTTVRVDLQPHSN